MGAPTCGGTDVPLVFQLRIVLCEHFHLLLASQVVAYDTHDGVVPRQNMSTIRQTAHRAGNRARHSTCRIFP